MKKDLADLCKYMKALVIPDMPEGFKVAERFRYGMTGEELRKAVEAFREFLYAFYDKLAAEKDAIDAGTRDNFNPYDKRDKTNARMCFPTLYDLTMILFSLGIRGRLSTQEKKLTVYTDDLLTVICDKTEKYISLIKMSGERRREMFRILSELGLSFYGLDLSKEIDFSGIVKFDVTYEKNDFFVGGLKLLAEATLNHINYYYIMNMFTVILQCDFYPLANARPQKHVQHINVFANSQAPEVGQWIKKMDELLISNGCTMMRSDGAFQYVRRGESVTHGLVCLIRIDITGCFVIPGVNHLADPGSISYMLTGEMADEIKSSAVSGTFSPEQCYRQSGNMGFAPFTFTHNGEVFTGCRHAGLRCRFSDGKCQFSGYRFDLNDPRVRDTMKKWIELELAM